MIVCSLAPVGGSHCLREKSSSLQSSVDGNYLV